MAENACPKQLQSRQWSCTELAQGMGYLLKCKMEMPEEALQTHLEDPGSHVSKPRPLQTSNHSRILLPGLGGAAGSRGQCRGRHSRSTRSESPGRLASEEGGQTVGSMHPLNSFLYSGKAVAMAGHAQHDERFIPRNLATTFDAAAGANRLDSSASRSSLAESLFPETLQDAPEQAPTTAVAAAPTPANTDVQDTLQLQVCGFSRGLANCRGSCKQEASDDEETLRMERAREKLQAQLDELNERMAVKKRRVKGELSGCMALPVEPVPTPTPATPSAAPVTPPAPAKRPHPYSSKDFQDCSRPSVPKPSTRARPKASPTPSSSTVLTSASDMQKNQIAPTRPVAAPLRRNPPKPSPVPMESKDHDQDDFSESGVDEDWEAKDSGKYGYVICPKTGCAP